MNDVGSVRWMVVFYHSEGGRHNEPDFPEVDFWHPDKKASMEAGARVLEELKNRGDNRDWKAAGHPDPFKVASGQHPGGQWILPEPPPKIFDPDTIPRASFDFDVDEFLRGIYEGRGRRRKESAG